MNEQNTYSAGAVKGKVIDFFISVFSNNFFIGNEVMYGTKRKLTDLLVVKDIGIYSVNEHNIKIIRKPKKQKNLDKNEMLFSMNSNYLKKHLNLTSSISVNLNSDEIRQQYVRESTTKIHKLFVDYMKQKIQSKFNLFIQNRGENTHVDDIPLLSSPLYIV